MAAANALATPSFYSAISLWAALAGSILLWTLILAGAVVYVATRGTRSLPRLATVALAVLFAMLSFFLECGNLGSCLQVSSMTEAILLES